MKLAAMVLMVAMGSARAQDRSEPGRPVTVYLSNSNEVPFFVRTQAKRLASDMFTSIGVTLRWKSGFPSLSETGAIAIEELTHTPVSQMPGAFAWSLPYEGVHIRIFWDRIKAERSPLDLLAYVIVHEIAHILQGIGRHSDQGIMKARWSFEDQSAMKVSALRFTPEDVNLIHRGMETRAAHAPNRVTLAMTRISVEAGAE